MGINKLALKPNGHGGDSIVALGLSFGEAVTGHLKIATPYCHGQQQSGAERAWRAGSSEQMMNTGSIDSCVKSFT